MGRTKKKGGTEPNLHRQKTDDRKQRLNTMLVRICAFIKDSSIYSQMSESPGLYIQASYTVNSRATPLQKCGSYMASGLAKYLSSIFIRAFHERKPKLK